MMIFNSFTVANAYNLCEFGVACLEELEVTL